MVSQHSTNYWRSVSWCLSWLAADMLTECCLGLGWQVPTVIEHMIQLGWCLEENNPDSWCYPNGLSIDSFCSLNCHSWEPKMHDIPIGHVQVPKTLTFKMRPSAQPFLLKLSFISMRMKNHFHTKGWALNLVLIQRPEGTRSEILSPESKVWSFCPNESINLINWVYD